MTISSPRDARLTSSESFCLASKIPTVLETSLAPVHLERDGHAPLALPDGPQTSRAEVCATPHALGQAADLRSGGLRYSSRRAPLGALPRPPWRAGRAAPPCGSGGSCCRRSRSLSPATGRPP